MALTKPVISLIFRKKDPLFFSLENVFSQVTAGIAALRPGFDIVIREVPHPSSSIKNLAANIRAARKDTAAVYHITGDIHYAVLGLPRKRTVLTIHDCVFLQQASGLKKQLLKRLWLTWPVRRAVIVTTISEKSKKEIIAYTGVRPDKIAVISNPVGEHIYYREKPFDRNCPVILFIGSTPNKNLDRVIEALEGIPCMLEIIGKISPQQEQRLRGKNIAYRTLQQIPEQELARRYAGCDLLLFPSTYEGFGLPVTEAQKAGRPVITSDLSPMKEVAGEAACLVDPFSVVSIREGIERIIRDGGYREELVKKGLENVKRFDKTTIAEQYIACYRRILKK